MVAHFFDIETLFKLDQKVWIIDKNRPEKPLFKMSRYDYNVIKNNLYLNKDLKLRIDNKYFYFNEYYFNKIKTVCKKHRTNVNDIEFSMVEFNDTDIIENIDYNIDLSPMSHLYRTKEVVYIICSKKESDFYNDILDKVNIEMRKKGIKTRDHYYLINDGLDVITPDEVVYKKIKILVQHLVGYKTSGNKFIDEKISDFNDVYYYTISRSEYKEISISDKVFKKILNNTEGYLKDIIKDIIKENKKTLTSNYVSSNKVNRFETSSFDLEFNDRLKRFGDL